MTGVGLGLALLVRALVAGAAAADGVVFENGRGLAETLSGRRLGDADPDDDGGDCSPGNTLDARRGGGEDVAGVELLVDDNLGVVEIVPE